MQPRTTQKTHPLDWLLEPLAEHAGLLTKPMFGCKAVYFEGRLVLVLAHDREPWRGLLLPTERSAHPSLLAEFPALRPHPVLGKWLYLPLAHDDFEFVAQRLVELVLARNPRVGIDPPPRKTAARKGKKRRSGPRSST